MREQGDDICTTFVLVNIKIEGPSCTHHSAKYCPDIWGDRIVWGDFIENCDGFEANIYIYDLSTKQEIQITSDYMDEVYPVIYGNRIVWQGYSIDREIWDIYTATICTAPNTTITAGPPGVITTAEVVKFSWTGSDDVSEPENLT